MHALKLLVAQHQRILELTNDLTGGAGDPSGTPHERRATGQRLVTAGSVHEAMRASPPPRRRRLTPGSSPPWAR